MFKAKIGRIRVHLRKSFVGKSGDQAKMFCDQCGLCRMEMDWSSGVVTVWCRRFGSIIRSKKALRVYNQTGSIFSSQSQPQPSPPSPNVSQPSPNVSQEPPSFQQRLEDIPPLKLPISREQWIREQNEKFEKMYRWLTK